MQTWKTKFRRIAAMVCALALCASLLPAGALADNTDSNESPSSQVVTATEPAEEEKTEETGTETEQPAEEAEEPGIAVMSLDPTEIYSADGIAISVQSGGAGWVPKTVNFKVIVDGTTVVENESIDVPTAATQLVVDAEGYDVTFDTTNDMTVEPGINNRYNVGLGSPDEYDCTINLVSSKTKDDIVITDGTTTYGTFSWSKVNAGNAAFTRTLTVLVNGEQVHQQTINTPKELTNGMATDQYWFTPNADLYLNSVEIEPSQNLIQTDPYRDVTVKLTTICGCGRDTCLCEGGCDCTADCTCDKCMGETLQDNQINTGYGILEYNPDATALYYNLTVEIYVNGQQKFVSEQLKVPGGITGAVNFEPADGYTYNMPNGYDMVVRYGTGSWDQNTGYIAFNGALPADQNYDNRLKIYLWTFNNVVNLDVERRLDISDDVTGYTISYTVTDADGNPQTYTYEATSFGAGQTQTIPKGTPVTLTAICSMGKEVSQWSWAEGYQGGTSFTGTKGQDGSEAYGNSVTLVVDGSWSDRIMVYIDELSDVKAPTDDELIDDAGLHKIFEDGAVIIDCVNPNEDHADREFGLLEGSFTVSELQGNSASGYYVDVTITDVNAYVDNSNLGQDVEHELAETATTKTIRLNWVVVQNENGSYTSAWKAAEPATIKVTCGEVEVPTKPDEPTITEIDDLLDVKVTCANNVPTHKETIYSVNYYTLGEVTSSDNGNTYTCVVTIPSANYIVDFNDASGMQHTCATESEEVTLVATKVDNVWKWQLGSGEKSMVEFQATCKPDDPTDDEIKILFGDTTLQVKCINESASHDAHTFALQDETFEVASVDFENGTYIATVNIAKAPYRDLYNEEVGTVHSLVDDTTVVTATLLYNGNEWVLPENATVTIDVTCDTTTDPGTDKPDEPTAEELTDAFGSKILVLCNQKNPNHYRGLRGAYYWLNQGNFSFTEVRQDADNGYYVEVTVEPGRYVELFSQATGVNHTLVSGQGNQTFRMYYTKGVWTPDVQQVTFNVTCSWTTVSGGDTPKDEHPEVGKAIANGTWGTPTPTPAASATSTIPQTSDSMPIGLLAGTAAIAAAAIALLLVLRKRRQQ